MSFKNKLREAKVIAVVCNQFGDTGKGKIVDYLAEYADIIARGTGGANAGHTIEINGQKFVFHITPSGILHDVEGKVNVIGNGVAFDPVVVLNELEILEEKGLTYDNLRIAYNAKLVLLPHLVMDRIRERTSIGRVGTTQKGIGPLYTDHVSRIGLIVNDLLNPDVFVKKLRRSLEEKVLLLRQKDQSLVTKVMESEELGSGAFYAGPEKIFDFDALVQTCLGYGKFFKGMITDTDAYMRESVGKQRILLEGAQGLLLSIDYGTYPHVTSSDSSIRGLAKGVGIREEDVELVLGIIKGFYMTRVGNGSFPTELGGKESFEWCSKHSREDEETMDMDANLNSSNEFEQGIALRVAGNEYGATTGRPRRVGWLDLPFLRYAMMVNGNNVVMTKLDVLDDVENIKVCESYSYNGPDYYTQGRLLRSGDKLDTAIPDDTVLQFCMPVYKTFDGWLTCTSNIRSYNDLPPNMKVIIEYVKRNTGANVGILTVGPSRDQIVVV